jgi:Tol biopolymer transport system component
MKKLIALLSAILMVSISFAQSNPLWLRYPAISPDGKTIAFGYKGDIYKVNAGGGSATPLTINEAQDMMPVWSHDGKYIAFASNRTGNFDVYVMPATGGAPVRLTYNSANDYPYDFSPDNKSVIFGSARNVQANNIRFYSPRLFQNLYSVPITGGTAMLISGAGIENAHYNSNGSEIVFQDRKGYEDPWRKHHVSAVTRDLWIMDLKNKSYKKITDFKGEDREPIWSNDDQSVYYLSEKNGSQNVFIKALKSNTETQLTKFKNNPVRHLSASKDNTLCFTYNGEIYTLANEKQPQKVSLQIDNDGVLVILLVLFPSVPVTKISPRETKAISFPLGDNTNSVTPLLIGEFFSICKPPSFVICNDTF